MIVQLDINGTPATIECEPYDSLLHLLRGQGLISVRYGSDTGETGASAVLVDGRLVNSDCMLAAQADGHEVTTIEAFNEAELHPIQAAFVATGAMQSG